jgi:phage shock protein E
MSGMNISLDELHAKHGKLEKNEIILDVRNPDEFSEGHIAGALNIPLPEVAERANELKAYETVYIHCKRGGRAKSAFETLQKLGYNNVICVTDAGMDAWIERNYPVAR